MENNHLTHFKIENFKKFDSLEVNDIGQFNLIVGDNNVGKTCLLEALSLDKRPKEIVSSLYHIISNRKDSEYYKKIQSKLNLLDEIPSHFELHPILQDVENYQLNILTSVLKDVDKPLSFNINHKIEIKIENRFFQYNAEENSSELSFVNKFINKHNLFDYPEIHKKSKNWLFFYENKNLRFLADITSKYYVDFFSKKAFSNIIYFSNGINEKNVLRYESFADNYDTKKDIISTLNNLFKLNILDFEFRKNEFTISTSEDKSFHSIKRYGEGIQRTILFFLEILCNENGLLFIDEIEIGLHHSKMKEVWIIVFKLVEKYNVQLFATTHSKECLEAYSLALEELKLEEKGKVILLQEEKEKIVSYTFETKNLDLAFDYRG